MPIPVIPDHFSAQVVFTGKTGRPEDVYVNTWYFRNDDTIGDPDEVADNLAEALHEFYDTTPVGPASPTPLRSYLPGGTINNAYTIKVSDLGQAAPRFPKIRTRTLGSLAGTAMPSEVAICLSYVASQNTPKNRGRIFFGPLANSVVTVINGRAVVSTEAQENLLYSWLRMQARATQTQVLWSPTDGVTKEITGAWVDNAFDTQRRRGEIASTRLTAGTYLGQMGTPLVLS